MHSKVMIKSIKFVASFWLVALCYGCPMASFPTKTTNNNYYSGSGESDSARIDRIFQSNRDSARHYGLDRPSPLLSPSR